MFNNIGKKIKTLATVLFWIWVIFSAIGGIILALFLAKPIEASVGEAWSYVICVLILIITAGIGFLLDWIVSAFIYGFGELIDDTEFTRQTNYQVLMRLDQFKQEEKE